MKKKSLQLLLAVLVILSVSGCTKRCRCIKYNTNVDYYTPEEVSSQNKTCSEMRYMNGLSVQRYSLCEWVYGE